MTFLKLCYFSIFSACTLSVVLSVVRNMFYKFGFNCISVFSSYCTWSFILEMELLDPIVSTGLLCGVWCLIVCWKIHVPGFQWSVLLLSVV